MPGKPRANQPRGVGAPDYRSVVVLSNSAEQPLPVRSVARAISDWVARLGRVWVEGQVTEVSRRRGMGTAFLTLRDPVAEVSLRVTCPAGLLDALTPPLAEGARVVVHAKAELYLARGTLTLAATEIRPIGLGELLARLERLKALLAAEGLFRAERKQPLPFLPRRVGLVTGRASAAERDVVDNARRRWPGVRIEVREVAVQGPSAVAGIIGAVRDLDAHPDVDVIVIARGGGSVEDLLPFSDEALLRVVAQCRTPVVSAIGHEPDTPLLDLVADVRASTPTDAAKRVVPDVGEETARLRQLRRAAGRSLAGRLDREAAVLASLRRRPVLATPLRAVEARHEADRALYARIQRCLQQQLASAGAELTGMAARVRALSPASTLARGYAVVQDQAGAVVRAADKVRPGAVLRARLASGELEVVVQMTRPAGPAAALPVRKPSPAGAA
jgi:exodeoxyribonuclease VII large subunit